VGEGQGEGTRAAARRDLVQRRAMNMRKLASGSNFRVRTVRNDLIGACGAGPLTLSLSHKGLT